MRGLASFSLLALLVACGEPPTAANLPEPEMPVSFEAASTQPSFEVTGSEAKTYILLVGRGVDESHLAASVEAAGGALKAFYPFGVAVASASTADFSASIGGVASAVEDVGFDVSRPVATEALSADIVYPPNTGDDDFFFDLQWGHKYVGAQEAWDAGVRGQGVRVAVLDGGFDLDHPDIYPNVNFALSKDFTGEGLQYAIADVFSHATHVSGTILAADNGFGTIGVAPEAELVAVKVLNDAGDSNFANVIAGIYWATMNDADIINMSLGAYAIRSTDAPTISMLAVAAGHATMYARQQGTLVIVSAGNEAWDLDGDRDVVRFMNGLPGTTGISALTTIGWGLDPENAQLVPASYTNYGTSMVDFSAPGGDDLYPGNEVCSVAGVLNYCWVFDLVFSTGNGGWFWAGGTSMAAPHAAGVAALIISANGGDMKPAQVERAMQRAAVQMARGKTDYFGFGLVNSGY
jgi:subtilisin family serine protease